MGKTWALLQQYRDRGIRYATRWSWCHSDAEEAVDIVTLWIVESGHGPGDDTKFLAYFLSKIRYEVWAQQEKRRGRYNEDYAPAYVTEDGANFFDHLGTSDCDLSRFYKTKNQATQFHHVALMQTLGEIDKLPLQDRRVLELLADGASPTEIAVELEIPFVLVRRYVTEARHKLHDNRIDDSEETLKRASKGGPSIVHTALRCFEAIKGGTNTSIESLRLACKLRDGDIADPLACLLMCGSVGVQFGASGIPTFSAIRRPAEYEILGASKACKKLARAIESGNWTGFRYTDPVIPFLPQQT